MSRLITPATPASKPLAGLNDPRSTGTAPRRRIADIPGLKGTFKR
jgi:hypothetical protein